MSHQKSSAVLYAADCSISVARQIETKGFEAAVSGNFFVEKGD